MKNIQFCLVVVWILIAFNRIAIASEVIDFHSLPSSKLIIKGHEFRISNLYNAVYTDNSLRFLKNIKSMENYLEDSSSVKISNSYIMFFVGKNKDFGRSEFKKLKSRFGSEICFSEKIENIERVFVDSLNSIYFFIENEDYILIVNTDFISELDFLISSQVSCPNIDS